MAGAFSAQERAIFRDELNIDATLKGRARRVGSLLIAHYNPELGYAAPGLGYIAKSLTMDKSNVVKAIADLEASHWFLVERRPGPGGRPDDVNRYRPNPAKVRGLRRPYRAAAERNGYLPRGVSPTTPVPADDGVSSRPGSGCQRRPGRGVAYDTQDLFGDWYESSRARGKAATAARPAGLAGWGSQPAARLAGTAPPPGRKTDHGLAGDRRLLSEEVARGLEHREEPYDVEDSELADFAVRVGPKRALALKWWMVKGKAIGKVAELHAGQAREKARTLGCERRAAAEHSENRPAIDEDAAEVIQLDAHKRELTDDVVAAIKPAPARRFVYDAEVPGFAVRVEPTGHRALYLLYRIPGAGRAEPPRKLKLGKWPACSVDQGRALAREAWKRIYAGGDPSRERRKAVRGRGHGLAES